MTKKNKNSFILVLGMHRCGTSALSGALEHMGISMGGEYAPPDMWNERGYFEDRRVVEINEKLLKICKRSWDSIAPLQWPRDSQKIEILKLEALKVIKEISANSIFSGIKDPRLSLTLPFWSDVIVSAGLIPKYLVALRSPASVVQSLKLRDGLSIEKGGLIYRNYLFSAIESLESGQYLIVDYQNLLKEPLLEMKSIADFIGLNTLVKNNRSLLKTLVSDLNHHKGIARQPIFNKSFENLYLTLTDIKSPIDVKNIRELPIWYEFRNEHLKNIDCLNFYEKIKFSDNNSKLIKKRLDATLLAKHAAEELAHQRLAQLQALELQLQETQNAQANAERIVAENTAELNRISLQLTQTESAKTHAEELANQYLGSLRVVELQLQETQNAQANAERIVAENTAELNRISLQLTQTESAKTHAEELANQYLGSLRVVELQLQETQNAQANAERIVAENTAELNRISLQLTQTESAKTHAEELANQYLGSLRVVELQLQETQNAQANAERIVAENTAELNRISLQLTQTESAKTHAEELANQYLGSLRVVELQLQETQNAQANAERIVAENTAELNRISLQLTQTESAKTHAEELANQYLGSLRETEFQLTVSQDKNVKLTELLRNSEIKTEKYLNELSSIKSTKIWHLAKALRLVKN